MPNYPKGNRGNIVRILTRKKKFQGNQFTDVSEESFGAGTNGDTSASEKNQTASPAYLSREMIC